MPSLASPQSVHAQSLQTLLEQCRSARLLIDAMYTGLKELVGQLPISDRGSSALTPAYRGIGSGRVLEGVFNGQGMLASDGTTYPVPPNYASKSKLVEGDRLKLTITPSGTFIYKQIAPVERRREVGTLRRSNDGGYAVQVGERLLRVLTASITYYHGDEGDNVAVLVPKDRASRWAAVDNIMNRTLVMATAPDDATELHREAHGDAVSPMPPVDIALTEFLKDITSA